MAIQTATTGSLENAQNIVIAECVYTAESQTPCAELITKYTLGKGEKSLTLPKAGQMTAAALSDGVDMINSADIGLGTTDLTPSEVGLKVILTDKLVRQFNEDVFKVIGKQMGDAMARYKDRAIIALFSALNGGTVYGADNKYLSLPNIAGCIANIRAKLAPTPIFVVHHPHAVGYLAGQAAGVASTTYYGLPDGFKAAVLRNFWKMEIDGINIFWDANIDKIAGYDSGYGVIASKSAMSIIESKAPYTERERDASLRAYEVVMVSDYGVFEIDDSYGAPLQYEIGTMTTNA